MRGEHLGKWYAEVYQSTRHVGTETISVHEFLSEKERDAFIIDYNQILLTHGGITPSVYRMATEPNRYVIVTFLKGEYNEH